MVGLAVEDLIPPKEDKSGLSAVSLNLVDSKSLITRAILNGSRTGVDPIGSNISIVGLTGSWGLSEPITSLSDFEFKNDFGFLFESFDLYCCSSTCSLKSSTTGWTVCSVVVASDWRGGAVFSGWSVSSVENSGWLGGALKSSWSVSSVETLDWLGESSYSDWSPSSSKTCDWTDWSGSRHHFVLKGLSTVIALDLSWHVSAGSIKKYLIKNCGKLFLSIHHKSY